MLCASGKGEWGGSCYGNWFERMLSGIGESVSKTAVNVDIN